MDPQHHQSPSSELRQVLVLRPPPVFAVHEQDFSNRFHILKAYESPLPTHDFLQAHAQSVKVVLCSAIGPITADVIRALPALQLVVSAATGVNHIDMAECRLRGIKVTNAGDVFSDDVADAAVGLLIDVLRRVTSGDRFVRCGRWATSQDEYSLGSKLACKRVGIVGLGNIGSRVATRLKAMGCIVSYTSRQKKHSTPFPFYPNILQLASNSDALVICCAWTNETHHMIDGKVMMALGKNGIIVNISRGALIDEAELVKCLVKGEIAGAGLDVFENEPNVPNELFELDNQVLVLRPPPVFAFHEQDFSNRFHILKAYDSSLPTHDFLKIHAQSAKAILCSGSIPITADVIRDLPALKLIVSNATGVDNIDMAECSRRGITVTNAGDVYADDVADAAVGLLIDVMRRITSCNRLGGKHVGIVGLGNIGSRVATRLEAMGCIVSYTSRKKKQSSPFIFYPSILQLALDSDALVLCCALNDNTRHMINNKVMMALGKKGIIVNVGRGALIDEVELVKCLVKGEIGGVGLDVFENEPNVPRELFNLNNVVFLPHRAAFTNESFYDVTQLQQEENNKNRKTQIITLMDPEDHHSQSSQPQVLVIWPPPVFAVHEQYISNKFQILKAYDSPLPTHDFLQTNAKSVKAVLCSGNGPITVDVLRDLPALQLVVTTTTGVNHIDMAECRRRGIRVTNVVDMFSDDVADAAVGLLIDVIRRISGGDKFVRGGRWPVIAQYPLGSKRIGIVGLGNIGSKVATRLDAMGCIVSYTSRQKKDASALAFYP
ncbi:hypothetical protein M8C21_030049, partial [Ambrosia artemisiifolia]